MVWHSPILLAASSLGATDYAIIVVYLIASVLIGTMTGKEQKSLDEYCLAGRRIPWWAACVSIVASDLSGISYMGVPAWIYGHDLKYNFGTLLMPLVMLIVVVFFVPVFYRAGVYTVYEYLERRFHSAARTITAILFLFKRGAWLAGAVYIPALALATAINIPLWTCILIIGLATTLYTMTGGMHAVIWTDLMQFIVLTGGLLLMIAIGMSHLHWSVEYVWTTASHMTAPASHTPHTTLLDFSFSFKTEATVWAVFCFYLVYNVGAYGTDQVAVQRYLTVKNFREMFKSIMGSSLLCIAAVFLMAFLGLVLVVFYHTRPDLAATLTRPDMIVPDFITRVLPVGAKGIIFAAIFAATMSVVSAGLNSFSTVGVVDLYRKYVAPGEDAQRNQRHEVMMAQLFTLLSGIAVTAVALWVSQAHTTILQTIGDLESKFVGPITGMFLLGILTKRANLFGVIVGVIAGVVVGLGMDWKPIAEQFNWMWIAPMTCVATYCVGYVASLPFAFTGRWASAGAASRDEDRTTVAPGAS